jgi:TolB-like protein
MGVVLHEMVTGRRPFEANSSAELVSAILRDTPPSVTELRPDLPSDLARIVRRCLEKDPRHRVQTARDVSNEFRDLARQTSQKVVVGKTSTTRTVAASDSGGARADEGFWVAVLPFRYTGASADLKALAEGLPEEIITGLSRFSYLRVIARGSAAKYSSESGDVRAIGKELGARYVMEGTLRQVGSKLRIAVQLADATTGAHLWAENFERNFSPESLFDLQDDLVLRIVSTVADMNGVLPLRDAAERAVALNPMDGNSVALLGELLTYAGSAERGMQLAGRAKQLNPNHPGSYWYADFYHAFSQGDYRDALAFALKVKLRGNPLAPMFIAAACGQLGDVDGGAKAAADLLKFRPELPALMRKQVAKVWNPEYGERFLEGLRKAGLEIPQAGPTVSRTTTSSTPRAAAVPDSGAARAEEGFWVAVLPFKYKGSNADLEGLADGLREGIITGLSRFSYLRVIARGSTAKYSSESGDVRAIGKELGARNVMEGSLRQAGSKLRLAVQLVDASSGAHLWAENYERAFSPETIFELQDDLVPRIVSTVADMNGILPRSMSQALRSRAPE